MNKLTHAQFRPCRGARVQGLRWIACLSAVAALFLSASTCPVLAGTETKTVTDQEMAPPVLGSKITGLLNIDVSDKYYTPRGLMSSNTGASFQPLLIVFFNLHSQPKGPLTDFSLNLGVWNDVDTYANPSEAQPGNWNEIDGFIGFTAKFYNDWKWDLNETFFRSQTDSYATTTNLDNRLTYTDHWFDKYSFSLNPFCEFFYETTKIAVVLGAEHSYYGVIGFNPTYKFKTIPLTLEAPTSMNIVADDFYQTYSGANGGAGVAVVTTQLKASTPLSFIPITYGAWTAYASIQYYHLANAGLDDGNRILTGRGPGSSISTNLMQFHFGTTCFF